MNLQTDLNSVKTKNRFKGWILFFFACIVIAAVVAIMISTNEKSHAYYTYLFKVKHFNKGDKMYLNPPPAKYKNMQVGISLYRLIRPITAHDIDSVETNPETRATLKLKINPLLE